MKIKLYTPFEKWYNNGTIFLYSDPHFQTDNEMEQYFGWPSSEERLDLINKTIGKNDSLICLGDIGNELDLVSKIKAKYKILITGNHDKGVSNYLRKSIFQGVVKTIEEAKLAVKKGEWFNGSEIVPVNSYSLDNPRWRIALFYDNKLFDEVYDGPLFINDKILLSHEKIELPFCINIHGHEHCGARIDIAVYENHISYSYNVAADVIDFIPVRLDKLIQEHPLKEIPSIHRLTIDRATESKGE